MSEVLDQDREAEATDPTTSDPDGDRGPVRPEEGPEDVLVPFVIPETQIREALTGAIDVWTMLNLQDRAMTLARSDEDQPEEGYIVVNRPITQKAEKVAAFLRMIAQSITASLRGQPLTVFELVEDSHARAARKGFWDGHIDRSDQDIANEKLLLVVSELTEAMEEVRSGHDVHEVWYTPVESAVEGGPVALKPEGFAIELADAMIRIGDLAGWFDIDLTEAVRLKAAYNETRPHMHGKQF